MKRWIPGALALGALGGTMAMGQDVPSEAAAVKEELQNNINIVWTLVAAILVFFMQAGFAMVEAGFTRAKNAVNILMKNLMDFSIGTLAFFILGFGLMFGGGGNGFPDGNEDGAVYPPNGSREGSDLQFRTLFEKVGFVSPVWANGKLFFILKFDLVFTRAVSK